MKLKIFKYIFSFIVLVLSQVCFGQSWKYKTFKITIVSPDTATIDESLNSLKDTVTTEWIRLHYAGLEEWERMAKKAKGEEKKELKEIIAKSKESESEIFKFKYYRWISIESRMQFIVSFLEIQDEFVTEVVSEDLGNIDYDALAKKTLCDYLVTYKNIHTENTENGVFMYMTTTLYSLKERSKILEFETKADAESHPGLLMECKNQLKCMLTNSAKASTARIAEVIKERERK